MFNPNEHLMDLKGKQYLQVMWRLVWFRDEKPQWDICTKLEQLTDTHAVFSARISDENGAPKASGYGSESIKDFKDFIEKAETKAIGRALAMLGYGTQFTGNELDEGERIVDSPVTPKAPPDFRTPEREEVLEKIQAYGKTQEWLDKWCQANFKKNFDELSTQQLCGTEIYLRKKYAADSGTAKGSK